MSVSDSIQLGCVFECGGVECGDVDGFDVFSVFVECVVEGSGEAGGIADHEHLGVFGGE